MPRQESKSGPIRTCVGCSSRRTQAELVRLYLDENGHVYRGRNGPGRGAWLCNDADNACLLAAVERNALARAFRQKPDRTSVNSLVDSWVTA